MADLSTRKRRRSSRAACVGSLKGELELLDGKIHSLPDDFRMALHADDVAKRLWTQITPLARNEWICWVTSAKADETRARRIAVGLDKMGRGMRRPCCWPGCPHR